MNIGVSGASGHLGSATVRELKARIGAKANIVAISRTPDKIAALGVETRAGDFDKPETLTEAFRGLDKLVVIPTSDMVPAARSKQVRVPAHADHGFRSMPITDSGPSRSPIPEQADR